MRNIVLIFLLFFSSISFGKVTLEKLNEFDKFHRQYALLYLSESIEVEDAKVFQEAIDKINTEGLHVKYDSVVINDSNGGNVVAAKKISRIIRKNKLSTWVPKDKYCSSACLYVFIGGICRMGQGKIGVHRGFSPYSYQRIRPLEEVKDTTDSSFNDDVKQSMIDYTLEKNASSRNLLAVYGFMNIVAVGLLFYMYKASK